MQKLFPFPSVREKQKESSIDGVEQMTSGDIKDYCQTLKDEERYDFYTAMYEIDEHKLRDDAELSAENAEIYSNRANSAVGLNSNTSSNSTIGDYFYYNNDDGALGSTDNLNINNQEEKDKTDIEGVPNTDDVGFQS